MLIYEQICEAVAVVAVYIITSQRLHFINLQFQLGVGGPLQTPVPQGRPYMDVSFIRSMF